VLPSCWHSTEASANPDVHDTTRAARVKGSWHSLLVSANHSGVQRGYSRAPGMPMERPTMRTHGYRSQLALCVAAAAGVLFALGLPWYAPARPQRSVLDGQLEGAFATVGRVVTESDGVTGWHALGGWATVIAGAAVAVVVVAAACLVPVLQGVAREALRVAALATLAFAGSRLLRHPGPGLELRHGALAASLAALVMVSAAFTVAAAPIQRRRVAPAPYAPPGS
jgi:hypothetical protein